jgi:hypothetical protein
VTVAPDLRALVDDPATDAAALQRVAAVAPELWPAIAAHPNVYPDLVDWMRANGMPEAGAPAEPDPDAAAEPDPIVAAEPEPAVTLAPEPAVSVAPVVEVPAASRAASGADAIVAWISGHRRLLLGVAGGIVAAVTVLVLVLALVVAPQQAAADARAAAEKAHAAAVTAFERATASCATAVKRYDSTQADAVEKLATDPGTLADASTLATLQAEIDAADAALPSCDAPPMAAETSDIEDQAEDLRAVETEIGRLRKALIDAMAVVNASAQDKLDAEAAAAAAAQAAAEAAARAARTWVFTTADGYSYTAAVEVDEATTTFTTQVRNGETTQTLSLGDACSFDPATDIAVPVTARMTATTQGFDTTTNTTFSVSINGRPAIAHEITVETYFANGVACQTPSYGSSISWNTVSMDALATGSSSTHTFAVIIHDWRTPATPNGDSAFLDAVVIRLSGSYSSGYTTTNTQSLTLSDQVR